MKKAFLTALALSAFMSTGFAADLPERSAVVQPPRYPAATTLAPNAFAGLSISGGLGLTAAQYRVSRSYDYANLFASNPDSAATGAIAASGSRSVATPNFSIEYLFALSSNVLLGARASYLFNAPSTSVDSGAFDFPASSNINPLANADRLTGYGVVTSLSAKNHWSAGLVTGYQISKDFAVFTGLNYHSAQINYRTATRYTLVAPDTVVTEANGGRRTPGLGVMVGGKYNLGSNWFVEANVEYTWFKPVSFAGPGLSSVNEEVTLNQTSKVRLTTFDTRIALGYRF